MKVIRFIIFLLITYQGYKFTSACASYAPFHQINDIEQSLKNESMVALAHSNPIYDNVGMLYYSNATTKTRKDSDFSFLASVVYIGDGICLTSAHARTNGFYRVCKHHAVCFEIAGKRTPLYHAVEFKIHPSYEEIYDFDIAALILERPVEGLAGLGLCYSFSKENKDYKDCQHLLTYVHYGTKLFCYDWLCITDYQRRAMQAYTQACRVNSKKFGIYSTPYRNSNDYKRERTHILFEAKGCAEMSGSACIHPDFGLVSITAGIMRLEERKFMTVMYLIFAEIIDIILYPINHFLFPVPSFNKIITDKFTRIQSVPLGAVEDWLEDIRQQNLRGFDRI